LQLKIPRVELRKTSLSRASRFVLVLLALTGVTMTSVTAEGRVDFKVQAGGDDLQDQLRQSSLLVQTEADADHTAQELFAAARADYARLLAVLYGSGRYSGVIRILIDGREAASIAPLDAPARIGKIEVIVDPGPAFRFSTARVAPLAPGTVLPPGFETGARADSDLISEAAAAGIDGWRADGRAKAAVSGQSITADHPNQTLAADIRLDPGPRLRFGVLAIEGAGPMREQRIRKIAGLRAGTVYSPDELRRAAERLRRTGIFSSVSLVEDTAVTAPDLLGVTAILVHEKPRRYRFGAEIASLDGLSLTGSWLHRNLLGGGERLSVEGSIANIGAQSSGVDYRLGVAIDRPATLTPDTTARLESNLAHLDEADYTAESFDFGLSFRHTFSDQLTGRVGITYSFIDGRDGAGDFTYRNLALPLGATWDRRNDARNATRGFYLDAEAKPFLGFGTTGSGLRLTFDGRGYRGFGVDDRVVVAARLQGGAIFGAELLEVPRDDLFYSGGGGTVRGQPYQSLGITVSDGINPDYQVGGTQFLAGSLELRTKVGDRLGLVGFLDAGRVSTDGFLSQGDWHAGAGLGLRYDTGLGPIRVDLAAPVGGSTGKGVQIYVGLGQSF
jgi:translocation and assembly module TamA